MNKRIAAAASFIILFALYIHLFPFNEVVPLKRPLEKFPVQWNGWTGRDFYFDDIILDKLRVSEYMMREYRKGNDKVSVYIGYYGMQKKGAQIHSPKNCLPGGGWFKLSENTRDAHIDGVGEVSYVEAVYQKNADKEVFIYWYKMKNTYITNEYLLKGYMILNSIRYRRNDAAFVRLSSVADGDADNGSESINNFMKDFLPLLKDYLPE